MTKRYIESDTLLLYFGLIPENELTAPMRTATAVIRVSNRKDTMVSVMTHKNIPKGKLFGIMEILKTKNWQHLLKSAKQYAIIYSALI